jgi:uncharacterized membrane protein
MRKTSIGLSENVVGMLCYCAGWLSGVIFLVLEPENTFVHFHAMQSAVVFGILTAAAIVFSQVPVVGLYFDVAILAVSFGLWLVLMIRAYQGARLKLPWAGVLSDRLTR